MSMVGVVGYGTVGKAYSKLFPKSLIFDRYITMERSVSLSDISNCDLAIICVPTPPKEDGSGDLSEIEFVVSRLQSKVLLIKSTIPPGTTEWLITKYNKRIVFSPEYLGESSYWSSYNWGPMEEPMFVIGGAPKDREFVLSIFKPILGPQKRYIQVSSRTAEMAKYMENCFFATKVTFCNEFFEICKTFGLNYDEVREVWLADPRINSMHTLVFDDNRGFGGKCYPKDMTAIIKASEEKGYNAEFLTSVIHSNKKFRND